MGSRCSISQRCLKDNMILLCLTFSFVRPNPAFFPGGGGATVEGFGAGEAQLLRLRC